MYGHTPLWSPGGCGPPGRPGAVRSRRSVVCDSSTLRGRATRKSAKSARPAAGRRAWAPPTALWQVHGRPALQLPLRRRGQLNAQHPWHRPLHRPGPVPVFLTAPPGTARHIVPIQHLRYWAGVSFGRAGVRYWAGVSSPHLRCGAGVGKQMWAGVQVLFQGRERSPGGFTGASWRSSRAA